MLQKGTSAERWEPDSVVPRAPGVTSSLQQLLVTPWVGREGDVTFTEGPAVPLATQRVQFLDGWTTDLCASRRVSIQKIVRLQLGLIAFWEVCAFEAFSSLPPSWLLNSICNMAPVFQNSDGLIYPMTLFGIKMYSENTGRAAVLTTYLLHQKC